MKLTVIPALLLALAAGPSAAIRFEADGVRVGAELVTGAAVSLKESGATPLLVSGSVVESLSGESLAVSLGDKQVLLGAGLRLARTAEGFRLSTHGMGFKIETAAATLVASAEAAFKVTDKGFDFGALGLLDGSSFTARVTSATTPALAAAEPQQVEISPEKPVRQGRAKVLRRIHPVDPLISGNAAGSIAVRQIGRVSDDGAP
ncbi:MAG: hypothetical protein HY293_03600 [Planctomycetes bacterium]|nr:hypothetical protein [Planctomycetota bacterium]